MNPSSTVSLYTGNKMPVIGLGTWQLTRETAETLAEALKLGFRMIDTSGDYGTQRGVGEAIKMCDLNRNDLFISTKVEEDDNAYKASHQNLKELDLSYVELMLVHRPPKTGNGEDLWEGLRRAKRESLALDIGVSNYSIQKMKALYTASGEMPAVNQIEWSPFGHSPEMLEFCRENQIVIMAYSPLTRGKKLGDEALVEIAERCGKTPAQVIIRWNLQHGVVPIVKANDMDHVRENLDVFDFELSDDDMATLNGLNEGFSSLGSLPYL